MISYFINPRVGFVYLMIEGTPTLDQYDMALREIVEDEQFHSELNWICDFLRADLNHLITLELLKFARLIDGMQAHGDPYVGVVSPVEHVTSVSDFIACHLRDDQICVFGYEAQAYRWLERIAVENSRRGLRAV